MAEQAGIRPAPQREMTLRALIIGGLLTFVFTAANVYFGLRVGLTFSTAIPADVEVESVAVGRRIEHAAREAGFGVVRTSRPDLASVVAALESSG